MLQNVLLQRGQQPAKGASPVSFSREGVWFKKAETLELNSYYLLTNFCIMSWQQRKFQIQGCCWLRDCNTIVRSGADLSRPICHSTGEDYRAMLPIKLKGSDGSQEFLPLFLEASVSCSQELVQTRSRITSSLAGRIVQPWSAPSPPPALQNTML